MKRAIALFLALVFVFGLIPVSSLATTGTLEVVVTGGTVTPAGPQLPETELKLTLDTTAIPAGKEFDYWDAKDDTECLSNFNSKVQDQVCIVGEVPDNAAKMVTLTAEYKTAEYEITSNKSSVVVAVGTNENVPDTTLPTTAKSGQTVYFRVEKGDGVSMKLKGTPTLQNMTDPDNPVSAGVTVTEVTLENADKLDYKVYRFEMQAFPVRILVAYQYLLTVVGATITSGATSNTVWMDPARNCTIIIIPEAGKTANDVLSWSSSPSVTFTPDASTPKTKAVFDMPSEPLTVFVNYNVNHVLKVTAPGNTTGAIDESGAIKIGENQVKEGVLVSVKPKLNPGETFVDWTIRPTTAPADSKIEISQNTEDGLIFTMPKFDVTIACNISKNKYNLYLSDGKDADNEPSTIKNGNNLVEVETKVTLDTPAAKSTGEVCKAWTITPADSTIEIAYDANTTDAKPVFKMPACDVTATPVFVKPTYTLRVIGDVGSVMAPTEKKTEATSANGAVVGYGEDVAIVAPANTDTQVFDHWEYTNAGIAVVPGATETLPTSETDKTTLPKTVFTMPISGNENASGKLTVTANYKYLITLKATDGAVGTINSTNTFFAEGETVTITAGIANQPGYVFKEWTVDPAGGATLANKNEATTTVTMKKQAVTITASYEKPYTVTMGDGGTVKVAGNSTAYKELKVAKGKSLTAIAAATYDGKAFDKWTVIKTGTTTEASLWKNADGSVHLVAEDAKKRVLNFYMSDEDITLKPIYAAGQTVSVTYGTVKSEADAADAAGAASGTYAVGKKVTITANAQAGYKFLKWTFSTTKAGKTTSIDIADSSSYTFTIMSGENYSATAHFDTQYSVTLQNNSLAGTTDTLTLKDEESAAGATSISGYFSAGEAIAIKTPEKIGDATFTNWILVSGSGTIANSASAETTFTVTSSNAVLAARYGGNVLIYKDAERAAVKDGNGNVISPATIFYTNWTYENYAEGTPIQLTASEDSGNKFTGWVCEPADLIRTVDGKKITFNMPSGVVKVYPSYEHKLRIAEAMYSLDGTTWIRGEGYDHPIDVSSGATVWIKPLDQSMAAPGDGTYTFDHWTSNSTRVPSTTAATSFTMPPEDVELTCVYKMYTLYVQRTVDHTQEAYALRPGQYITLDSGEATGGRQFNYWGHTDGVLFTVNDTKYDEKYASRLISQRITVQMPAKDAEIVAWFSAFDNPYYWSSDAFIRIQGEPKRYYALLESFMPYSMQVIYYPGAGEPGNVVDPRDYRIDIVKAGTFDTSGVDANGMFVSEGEYDLLVTMYIDGVQWAPTIRVMNDAYTHLYCAAEKPEFVRTFTKPAKTVYYEKENVVKDGLDIQLLSVNHVTGTLRYSVQRELAESEYQLYPRCYVNVNSSGDALGLKDGATTKLPTVAEIEQMIADGTPGVKVQNGKYYVQMWVYCLNSALLDTDGNPTIMQYLINEEADKIWVEVRRPLAALQLDAERGINSNDEISKVPQTTYPTVAWTMEMNAGMGERLLTISAPGSSMEDQEIMDAIEIENSDPNVAYLVDTKLSTPLVKKLVIKAPGVTTITVRARGTKGLKDASGNSLEIKATCEVTVKSSDVVQMTAFTALNKTAMTLFVGNTITLAPYEYAPANANTACKWDVSFEDSEKMPDNAEFYVSVSEGGVVKVLKPTDRKVVVTATPLHWDKDEGKDANGVPHSDPVSQSCVITVIQVPVDNMTISATAKTMYRLSSAKLKVALYPEAASIKDVIWTSSDSGVVSVDNDGNLTAHKVGTATITATAASSIPENGDMTKAVYQTCAVSVRESVMLTGLMLNKTNITLGVDDTIVLSPYFTPATATTQSVTWTSSDTAIATVDSNGKVRGLAEGAVLITAKANDGSGLSASCVATVTHIIASAVVLNKQTLALIEDETETLAATVYPTNVSVNKVVWTSSNENVATVDPDGVVTATGGGSAVITATAKDASTKYADCVVAVTAKIPVTSITLNLGDFDILLNDTTVLKETIAPANATYKTTWTSSNAAVASVDEKGKVSALTTGQAVITCKAGDMTKAITVSVVTKTYSTGKVVNCARRVNVRANSSGGSSIVGYAYLGDVYKVLDKSGNWYKIQYNATTTAYIWHRYLSATETGAGYVSAGKVGSTTTDPTTGTTTTPAPTVTAKTLTIANCTYCVNVRSGAGTNFSRLGYAYLDESFTYTGVTGDWYIITYNGATAYVSSQFVKVNG